MLVWDCVCCCREGIHLRGEEATTQKGRGKPKDMGKKAVLLCGPPGIGKTSSATIITRSPPHLEGIRSLDKTQIYQLSPVKPLHPTSSVTRTPRIARAITYISQRGVTTADQGAILTGDKIRCQTPICALRFDIAVILTEGSNEYAGN